VSIQSANDGENDKAIARAWGRLIAALLNMFSSAFDVVGSFFDITREVLKATILGIQRAAFAIGNIGAAIVKEGLMFCLEWIRKRRKGKVRGSELKTDNGILPERDGLDDLPQSLHLALRQANLASETAKRTTLEAAGRIRSAFQAAELAEEAARKHQTLQWQTPAVGPLRFEGSSIIYYGEMREGEACGYGTFEHNTSVVYRGQVSGNRKHGFGICSQGGKTTFEGEFDRHRRHGLGRIKTESYEYTGQFAADEINGYGILVNGRTFADWDTHSGFFKKAEASGFGIRHYRDGQVYFGEFRDDVPHGIGVIKYADSVIQSGQWQNGERVGP
jgi:hypothetical protein